MRHAAFVLAGLLLATPAAAQPPHVINGRVDAQPAGASLDGAVRSLITSTADVAWIGYSVPAAPGDRTFCWSDGDGIRTTSSPIRLEGPSTIVVLLRVEARRVERIRVSSPDCELDAGGRALHWLSDVTPSQSLALLSGFVSREDQRHDRVSDGAITAIALHADASADTVLDRLASAGQPEAVRKKAVFWLGQARGRRGFQTVLRIALEDESPAVRKSAIFALSQSEQPEALPSLIQLAREDRSPDVRGEAIFWLAQKAGRKAADAITERLEQDPDTDVKKRAVFALSQLPKDEGVPLLIQVARSNRNPAVRKQAMFWLGQSKDPRALEFFAEILR